MAASAWQTETVVVNMGTTNASGVATISIDLSLLGLDRVSRVRCQVKIGTASSGHMNGAADFTAEGVYWYRGSPATFSLLTAISGSVNPLANNSTGEENAWPQAADGGTIGGSSTAVLTASGTSAVLTVTAKNPGGAALSGATVFCKYTIEHWGIT